MIEHKATPQFWQALEALPEPIQTLAHKNFALLKQNPEHPSLHFKSVGALWCLVLNCLMLKLSQPCKKIGQWLNPDLIQ